MSRGPYKSYEYDPTASVPKTTLHNKRKRYDEAILSMQDSQECQQLEHEPTHGIYCNTVGYKY